MSREAWAEIVNDLVASEAAGVKARFARLVGVDYKTVLRWLRGDVDVSEALIRQVADRLHISPLRLLVQVGLYDPSELSPAPEPKAEDDPALQAILEANVPPRVKSVMIQRLQRLREREREREAEEVRWWIEQAEGA